MSNQKINDFPESSSDFWEGEKYGDLKRDVRICASHTREDLSHKDFIDNHDGTVSCKYCPFGAILPGYMRVHEGRIVDLRKLGN